MTEFGDIVILAGGFGKRLESVSQGIPKPLVPVGEGVFLDYVLGRLSQFGIKRVLLSLCYKPEAFFSYLEKRSFPFDIIPVCEPVPLGTGGAIRYVLEQQDISPVFGVVNGDSLVELDLRDMVQTFSKRGCKAMVGLSHVQNAGRYGSVTVQDNRAVSFSEKTGEDPGWINNGCYLFDRQVFDAFQGTFSVERDMFPQLVRERELYAYQNEGFFIDIGIPEAYGKFIKMVSNQKEMRV